MTPFEFAALGTRSQKLMRLARIRKVWGESTMTTPDFLS